MRRLAVLVPLVLVALPGCCGGGIDRAGSRPSLAFALAALGTQTARDAEAFSGLVAGAPAALARDVSDSPRRLAKTAELYCGR